MSVSSLSSARLMDHEQPRSELGCPCCPHRICWRLPNPLPGREEAAAAPDPRVQHVQTHCASLQYCPQTHRHKLSQPGPWILSPGAASCIDTHASRWVSADTKPHGLTSGWLGLPTPSGIQPFSSQTPRSLPDPRPHGGPDSLLLCPITQLGWWSLHPGDKTG